MSKQSFQLIGVDLEHASIKVRFNNQETWAEIFLDPAAMPETVNDLTQVVSRFAPRTVQAVPKATAELLKTNLFSVIVMEEFAPATVVPTEDENEDFIEARISSIVDKLLAAKGIV